MKFPNLLFFSFENLIDPHLYHFIHIAS